MTADGLLVRGVSKTFAGTRALTSFSIEARRGQVHALAGENGSGKSTFIKILSGFHRPDAGRVSIDGEELVFGSPAASYALGARFVHQDLGLIESCSVLDNLSLSTGWPQRWGSIREKVARRAAADDLARLELDIDPSTLVGNLSPALRTGVAAARALRPDDRAPAKLLVLDEPTARLPEHEVEILLDIVRAAAKAGLSIVYVTHRLDELFDVADAVTVLRDGAVVGARSVEGLTRRELVNMLVGHELDEAHERSQHLQGVGDPVLRVDRLASGTVRDVSFSVRRNEIVGISGITGSGRETVLPAVFGAMPRSGLVAVGSCEVKPRRPADAVRAGMAYIPADRKQQGGVMALSVRENIALTDVARHWRFPRIRRAAERREMADWFSRFAIRPLEALDLPLATLSGGNQQKAIYAKWLRRRPAVLLLEEPTQGVDVGAKAELHRQVIDAAAGGAGVLVASSDLDELAALCHRVLVFRGGRVVRELGGHQISAARLAREAVTADEPRPDGVAAVAERQEMHT